MRLSVMTVPAGAREETSIVRSLPAADKLQAGNTALPVGTQKLAFHCRPMARALLSTRP